MGRDIQCYVQVLSRENLSCHFSQLNSQGIRAAVTVPLSLALKQPNPMRYVLKAREKGFITI